MSGFATKPTTHKAIKRHVCTWCWQAINPGEKYSKYRWFNGGDAGTVKTHPECLSAIYDYADEEGGWCEWTPGMDRPAPLTTEPATTLEKGIV